MRPRERRRLNDSPRAIVRKVRQGVLDLKIRKKMSNHVNRLSRVQKRPRVIHSIELTYVQHKIRNIFIIRYEITRGDICIDVHPGENSCHCRKSFNLVCINLLLFYMIHTIFQYSQGSPSLTCNACESYCPSPSFANEPKQWKAPAMGEANLICNTVWVQQVRSRRREGFRKACVEGDRN